MKDNPPPYSSHLSLKLPPDCTYSHWALNMSIPVATQIRCGFLLLCHRSYMHSSSTSSAKLEIVCYLGFNFPLLFNIMRPQDLLVLPVKYLYNPFPIYPRGHCLSLETQSALTWVFTTAPYLSPKALTCPCCPP